MRIFPDQGVNPCLLHWQADSFTIEPPGKSHIKYFGLKQKHLLVVTVRRQGASSQSTVCAKLDGEVLNLEHIHSTKRAAAAAAAKSLQSCPTLCNPRDCSPPGSPVPGFSRQEHWSGLSFPSPMQ